MAVVVRIFAEWGRDSPLWGTSGEPGLAVPLSDDLAAKLSAWNHRWEKLASDPDHEDDDSWVSWSPVLEWNVEGYALARMVRAALPADTQLIYYDYVTDQDVLIEPDGGA